MLLRCAPARLAVRQLARFGLTSMSLTARRLVRQRVAPDPVFQLRVRLRVLGAVALMTRWALRERRAIGRRATVARSTITARWLE
jgi:hypothetical protein